MRTEASRRPDDPRSPPGRSHRTRESRCRAPLRESKVNSHMACEHIVSSWRKGAMKSRGERGVKDHRRPVSTEIHFLRPPTA